MRTIVTAFWWAFRILQSGDGNVGREGAAKSSCSGERLGQVQITAAYRELVVYSYIGMRLVEME
jgi:hypothetical protein